MLLLLHKESLNRSTNTGGVVLNTQFMSELRVYGTTSTMFKYVYKPEDRHSGIDNYIVSETLAAIRTKMDTALNANALTLNVYTYNNPSLATVATVFLADEIVRVSPDHNAPTTRSWLYVNQKGFGIDKYLINHYYVNVAALAELGVTTTTSSTTTTT